MREYLDRHLEWEDVDTEEFRMKRNKELSKLEDDEGEGKWK